MTATPDRDLPRSVFLKRNFILLWLGYGISAMGDHLSELALLKMQTALDAAVTATTRMKAMMNFAVMLPFFIVGPGAGWLSVGQVVDVHRSGLCVQWPWSFRTNAPQVIIVPQRPFAKGTPLTHEHLVQPFGRSSRRLDCPSRFLGRSFRRRGRIS